MKLDPLFHWSPSERRDAITRMGLVPYSHPVVHTGSIRDDQRLVFPYICLAPTPSLAWGYSAASRDGLVDEFDGWDLWQVRLADTAEVHVLPCWGPYPQEVRVRTTIAADACWYVATRTSAAAVPA